MLNGRYDYMFQLKERVLPMRRLLGTPEEHKKLVLFDSGHYIPFRNKLIKETLDWLDRYLDPVKWRQLKYHLKRSEWLPVLFFFSFCKVCISYFYLFSVSSKTFPLSAPLYSPSSMLGTPLMITYSTPVLYWLMCKNVALSLIVSGLNIVMSALCPLMSSPLSFQTFY